ncbi:MAG: hypothetical protein Q4F72_10270 [Desulfovibrionaceae bacterium]|nr:hypothetical protein [Desulfovibrionaceae bacterium]
MRKCALGVLPATCLISAFIRTGHALGPIVSGLMLPLMSVAHGTFLTGMSILTCTLLFLFLSDPRETETSA